MLCSENGIGFSGGAAVAAILPRLTALQNLRLVYLPHPRTDRETERERKRGERERKIVSKRTGS